MWGYSPQNSLQLKVLSRLFLAFKFLLVNQEAPKFVQFDATEVLDSANELVDGVLKATDVVESATEVVKVYEVDRYPFSTWDPY